MIRLEQALQAWGTPDFKAVLKQEVALLSTDQLPLQQGLTSGNYVTADPVTVMINSISRLIVPYRRGVIYHALLIDQGAMNRAPTELCAYRSGNGITAPQHGRPIPEARQKHALTLPAPWRNQRAVPSK